MVDNADIWLEKILIWCYFFVDEVGTLVDFNALGLVFGNWFILDELQLYFSFEEGYLAEVRLKTASFVVFQLIEKVFRRDFYLNSIDQSIFDHVPFLLINVIFFNNNRCQFEYGWFDIDGKGINGHPWVSQIVFICLLVIDQTFLNKRDFCFLWCVLAYLIIAKF